MTAWLMTTESFVDRGHQPEANHSAEYALRCAACDLTVTHEESDAGKLVTTKCEPNEEMLRQMSAEDQQCRAMKDLSKILRDLGPDELRVLTVFARRLLMGQSHYGKLDIATDKRDWKKERAEELFDALVYTCIEETARKT